MVRSDLSPAQQAVQACHAAIKASRSFLPETAILNPPNLVVCTIADEPSLKAFLEEVNLAGLRACSFQEDDLGGQTTAMATELVSGERRKIFRKLRLLQGAVAKAA